ncbi:BtpA/SgcQ family protein [Shinella sp.]|uniref:BtpA/SgcQ family protein n=1 Tax=Shinella sp. TaxID=1870904 RepID=UPI0029AFCAC1|nr:BtpA/SgcQ family protein [Shinella sp.]MDX3974854.1 BtpA/SgcQ family protein [Shinella sp.]
MTKFADLFPGIKPVIAMVHLNPMPGTPLYDADAGVEGIYQGALKDLDALQAAGVDAVMFGNENDRPYELKVDIATTTAMAFVIGRLVERIEKPFGVNVLWDPDSTVALAAATGAAFVREIFTGTYASDMGPWTPNAGRAMRRARQLDRKDLVILNNVSAEFAASLDSRPLADRARSAVFSSIPDAVLVSGAITGESAKMVDLESVKKALPDTPVLANTGVKHATVADVLKVADGCVVGSSLKVDGHTWNAVDPQRAKEFMAIVRKARG